MDCTVEFLHCMILECALHLMMPAPVQIHVNLEHSAVSTLRDATSARLALAQAPNIPTLSALCAPAYRAWMQHP